MRVLLIFAPRKKMLQADMSDTFEEESGFYPPLGILYIASYMKENSNHEVEILDTQVEDIDYDQIKDKIRNYSPQVVGITTMTFNLLDVMDVAKAVKEVDRNIHVNLGGPHPYMFQQESINLKFVDSLTIGEGEITFTQLVNSLEKKECLDKVKGIIYKRDGKVIYNEPRGLIEDLDSLPNPDRTLIPYQKYHSVLAKDRLITTMMTSRGCPFRCIYCHRPHMGKKFRSRNAFNIVKEMKECMELGIREFIFFDDIFTLNRRRVFEVCDEILNRHLKVKWSVRARVDTVDYDMLVRLKEAGCNRIQYGIEAGTDKVLKILKKGTTLKQAVEAIRISKEVGMTTLADFMIGSPGETKEDILQTINFALKLNPDYAQFSVTTPYPATELYTMGFELGLFTHDYWKEFAQSPTPNFKTLVWEENLKKEELVELLNLAYKRFYTRPQYILKQLLSLSSIGEFKRKAKAGLKVFSLK
ncbi:MAG: radical SAM protein [bacterium]